MVKTICHLLEKFNHQKWITKIPKEHTMPRIQKSKYRKNIITLAVGAILAPGGAWALDIVQAPPLPTAKSAFVAPNVIISIDDSGSMGFRLDQGNTSGAINDTAPTNGVWSKKARRMNVLKYALTEVFSDPDLVPDGKIRLGWQAMWNNGNNVEKYSSLDYWYGSGKNPGYKKTPGAKDISSSVTGSKNQIRPLDNTQRQNFLEFVSYLLPQNGTPSHAMFKQADDYMRATLSSTGPWSTDPGGTGEKSTEYLGCRRNYHIFMTDGRWNGATSGGNQDGKSWTAQGGRQAFSTSSDQTRLYTDSYGDQLADWAFKSWMDPLQNPASLLNSDKLKPSKEYDEAPATETFTTGSGENKKTVNLQKYWNPKYNPATWPHMVTYTIGFSDEAITWPGASQIEAADITLPVSPTDVDQGGYLGYNKGFADIATGAQTWPKLDAENKRSLDLWHAAINGRGRFYPVSSGEDLEKAFRSIIGKINEESATLPEKIQSGGSTSGYNMSNKNVGNFATVYEAKKAWKGYVTATDGREPEPYPCKDADGNDATCYRSPSVVEGWSTGGVAKTTADRLDSVDWNTRLVLSWNDKTRTAASFKWASDETYLSSAQKASLGKESSDPAATTKNKGQNVLNYIRGDRSLEADPATAAKPYRQRVSIQGDIINSVLWYTGAPAGISPLSGYSAFVSAQKNRLPMLYVGGNDGMFHGFSAKDGFEKIAYVPRGVMANLKGLADPDYEHRYYVDGSPMSGDIRDGSTWKTMLVGTLGAGGKGYFLMDVTKPDDFIEGNAATLVPVDRTRGNVEAAPDCSALTGPAKTECNNTVAEDRDIGNITAQPSRKPNSPQETTQITLMNNGRWAAVMGNGYNSANQRPVLLVQYLDGARELVRVQTTTAGTGTGQAKDNGLAAPTLVDLNGDGTVDIVYAGDNLGNLWKFDVTSDDPSEWKSAFGPGNPLFTARGLTTIAGTTRNQVQPITAAPIVQANDRMMKTASGETAAVGGMMVAFGTGRNLTEDDRKTDINQPIQTIYSVLDNARYRKRSSGSNLLEIHPGQGNCSTNPETCVPVPAAVGTMTATGLLAKQSISTVQGDLGTVNAIDSLDKDTWKNFKGWYLDLPGSGERMIQPMQFFDGSNILAAYTESPSGTVNASSTNLNESCVDQVVDTSPGTQWRTLINIMDGKRPSIQLVDANGDGVYKGGADADSDKDVNRKQVAMGTPTLITKGDRIIDTTGGGKEELARMPEQSTRPSWRQLN
ncbi:pilus assembly protein [Comamonas flocculans]